MTANEMRIARVERTLRWFEEDVSQLAMRVKDLSAERQTMAKDFAARIIDHTRAELDRLRAAQALISEEGSGNSDPAD